MKLKSDQFSIGDRTGTLTIIGASFNEGRYRRQLVQCDCGTQFTPIRSDVEWGRTRSCGCATPRRFSKDIANLGHSRTKVYLAWSKMVERCGIGYSTMCEEWRSFLPFREWAMANGFDEGLTLDRIDNALGYSPSNCRFVTRSEQTRNRTATTLTAETALALRIAHYYSNDTLAELAARFGMMNVSECVRGRTWRDVVHFPDARQHGVDRRTVAPAAEALTIARAYA